MSEDNNNNMLTIKSDLLEPYSGNYTIEGFSRMRLYDILSGRDKKYVAITQPNKTLKITNDVSKCDNGVIKKKDIILDCISKYYSSKYTSVNDKDTCARIASVFNIKHTGYPSKYVCLNCHISLCTSQTAVIKRNSSNTRRSLKKRSIEAEKKVDKHDL